MTLFARSLLAGCLISLAAAVPGAVIGAQAGASSPRVFVRDPGPARAGRWLSDALAAPHVLLLSDSLHPAKLERDTTFSSTVVVLGPAIVASTVHGDVIAVGGDLFLHPGVRIDGRAIAIGGGVYSTSLGSVGGGVFSHPDFTYQSTTLPDGSIALDYAPLAKRDTRVVVLPGLYGIRFPSYDRSNGLSLTFGPTLRFDTSRVEVDPLVSYRSQLGTVDGQIDVRALLTGRLTLEASVGRMTLSNDAWIHGNLSNSISTIFSGADTRNYYRANRAELRVGHRWEGPTTQLTVLAGGLGEKASSVRPDTGALGGPWSLFNRHDVYRMLRPNPRISPGTIASGLAGVRLGFEDQMVVARLVAETEIPFQAPGDGRFVQTTIHGFVGFPTFKTQRLVIESHAVLTAGDTAPPQRFAYLGGSGTLPTFELLEFGGDELFYAEGNYIIPIDRVVIRYLGSPTLTLRYITGGAAIGRFPTLEQNVGARVGISLLRVEYLIDPASRRSKFGVGLSFFR